MRGLSLDWWAYVLVMVLALSLLGLLALGCSTPVDQTAGAAIPAGACDGFDAGELLVVRYLASEGESPARARGYAEPGQCVPVPRGTVWLAWRCASAEVVASRLEPVRLGDWEATRWIPWCSP